MYDAVDRPHDFTALWVVHDAVRRDLVRLVSLLGGTAPVRTDRRAALRAHWQLMVGVLDAHEAAEDSLLWPVLRAAVPSEVQATVDLAVGQHPGLIDATAEAAAQLAADDAFDAGAQRESLAATVERVSVLADHHFGVEERRLLPLAEQWLPRPDWDAFVRGWLASPGPGGREVVLPFLLESAHRDRAAAVLHAVDEADREAYAGAWKPAHRERVSGLW